MLESQHGTRILAPNVGPGMSEDIWTSYAQFSNSAAHGYHRSENDVTFLKMTSFDVFLFVMSYFRNVIRLYYISCRKGELETIGEIRSLSMTTHQTNVRVHFF